MLNNFYYYEHGKSYETKVTLKTEEELELCKQYIPYYDLYDDEKNPGWKIAYLNGYKDECRKLRTRLATLRKKRGVYHHWTYEDAISSMGRAERAVLYLEHINWNEVDIKDFCSHVDKFSDYFEKLLASHEKKG